LKQVQEEDAGTELRQEDTPNLFLATVIIRQKEYQFLLDTGTNQSFILKAIVKEVGVQPSGISLQVRLPNGEETYCSHSVTLLIKVDGHQLPQKLAVIE
jgi:hypothetical protein